MHALYLCFDQRWSRELGVDGSRKRMRVIRFAERSEGIVFEVFNEPADSACHNGLSILNCNGSETALRSRAVRQANQISCSEKTGDFFVVDEVIVNVHKMLSPISFDGRFIF